MLDDQSLIGHKLDQRYVIHELIARGGMASVFRATDDRLERVVAVKIMHPNGAHTADPDQFTREAKLAARLNHRGIVSVYDQGTDGNLTYLVMEYVPGKTLRDVMREEAPMSPRRALAYLEPILIALSEAHASGLIHRDMKPENVLISTTGEVKVADFGLARAATVDQHTTSVLIGTVSYLAPEVIAHQAVDPRADIYACGAILFEMLTGRKPHIADTPIAIAHKHIAEDVKPPSELIANIPPYVDALTLRALARDRAQRSPDARTFLYQVRMVQRALADGLTDDPELTNDLMPGVGPTPAAPPQLPGRYSDSEATAPVAYANRDFEATAAVSLDNQPEHTVAWTEAAGMPSNGAVDQNDQKVGQRRKHGKGLLWLAIIALILAGVFGWWLSFGRFTDTPDVINMTSDEAVKTLEAAGFSTDFAPETYSEDIDKGSVVATGPSPGERILPGSTIVMTLSKGKERYKIPNVQGKTLNETQTILGSLNLQTGNISREYHDTIKDGSVIRSSSHKVDQLVKRDTAIDLVLSRGPAPVDIPNHTGKSAASAEQALKDLGLKVTRKEAFSDTVPKGNVIKQSPKSGSGHRGDTITLTVSKGPELFNAPDLDDMTETEAREKVESMGLKLNATRNPFAGSRARVQYQSPSAGTKVKRGDTITVFLN